MEITNPVTKITIEIDKFTKPDRYANVYGPDEIVLSGIFSRPILKRIIEKLDLLEEIQKQQREQFNYGIR